MIGFFEILLGYVYNCVRILLLIRILLCFLVGMVDRKVRTRYTMHRGYGNMIAFFSLLFGEDSHFDEHIFQMGWFNHQPGR